MPSLLTHYFFAKKTIPNQQYRQLALLGAQGTDPFFFYGTIIHRRGAKEVQDYGMRVHHQDPTDFFAHWIELANNSPHREMVFAYLHGLLNHYCLDRTCHPYVFYFTGTNMLDHQRFEANIDCCLQHLFKDYTSPSRALKTDKKEVKIISSLFGVDFYRSYKDMRLASKILYSHFGIRKFIFKTLMKDSQANAMSTPKNSEGNIDYLNLKNLAWQSPATAKIHYCSFIDLFEKAEKDYKVGKEILNLAYQKKDYLSALKDFCNNINHDGVKDEAVMKVFSSVYA